MTESIDTSTNSLTCTYDEETNVIHFEWDAEANPEYNYLLDIAPEELIQKMVGWIKDGATSDDVVAGTTKD
jgi:hypothetical protein